MPLTRCNLLYALPFSATALASGVESLPKRALRVLFLTDIHLPATGQDERVGRCLDRALKEKPDLILLGNDRVIDVDRGDGYPEADADARFANFRRVVLDRLKEHRVAPVLGNHDLWHSSEAKVIAAYGMPHRYYRIDLGGWRFLMLDTFHEDRTCRVDDAQMAWLKAEIDGTNSSVLLLSHAPILTVTSFLEDATLIAKGGFAIPERWQSANLQALRDRSCDQPHVRLALSGHMHQIDRCDFDRVAYVCGGAVCGN